MDCYDHASQEQKAVSLFKQLITRYITPKTDFSFTLNHLRGCFNFLAQSLGINYRVLTGLGQPGLRPMLSTFSTTTSADSISATGRSPLSTETTFNPRQQIKPYPCPCRSPSPATLSSRRSQQPHNAGSIGQRTESAWYRHRHDSASCPEVSSSHRRTGREIARQSGNSSRIRSSVGRYTLF